MEEQNESETSFVQQKPEEAPKPVRVAKKIIIPRREKSIVIEPPRVLIMTAGIKPKPIKLNQCQVSPLTLYELAAEVVDRLNFPQPFTWNEEQVADWMDEVVGLPQYRECIIDNHINGKRLLRLEDPSDLAAIGIRDFIHIKKITSEIRRVFATDYILFSRSVGLPIRKPLTHCTWFKSRTGPSWGIRVNWTRCDILRWMKILRPKPLHLDHWDLVWYLKPDFPMDRFARIKKAVLPPDQVHIPHYYPPEEYCNEFLAARRFRIQADIPEQSQLIWMEHLPGSPSRRETKRDEEYMEVQKPKRVKKKVVEEVSRLVPPKVTTEGKLGKALILARRKMAVPKFLP